MDKRLCRRITGKRVTDDSSLRIDSTTALSTDTESGTGITGVTNLFGLLM